MHIPWPEIESFHNIRKYSYSHPEILKGQSKVIYKCKVKLHGTNSAIQWTPEGDIVCQSRSGIITTENDNAGFARWVKENEQEFKRLTITKGMVVFGEWCGPGIQKGVAISQIPKRVFAVFAIRPMNNANLIVEPSDIQHMIGDLKVEGLHILPWYEKEIDIDWKSSDEELTKITTQINQWVSDVEANDPWVEKTFDVKGTGEGLVFYPGIKTDNFLIFDNFQNLVFKAKGEKHKNIKTAAPAQVNAEVAASIDSFVDLVLTTPRLEQGATAVGGYDMKLTGKFVSWCLTDVAKETADELEASGLDWKQVQKSLTDKVRSWYLEQVKTRP